MPTLNWHKREEAVRGQIRNPKAEVRKKAETRKPNARRGGNRQYGVSEMGMPLARLESGSGLPQPKTSARLRAPRPVLEGQGLRLRNAQVAADFAGQKPVDLRVPGDGGTKVPLGITPPGVV